MEIHHGKLYPLIPDNIERYSPQMLYQSWREDNLPRVAIELLNGFIKIKQASTAEREIKEVGPTKGRTKIESGDEDVLVTDPIEISKSI